jgi:transposase
MGVKGRRTYDDQFKADAVRLGTESNKTIREVAQSLGIEPGTLHTWIRQRGKRSGDTEPGRPGAETLEEEVRRLRRDLARVTDERDFLKKATAYFAKESK